MRKRTGRNCKNCKDKFQPDPRNAGRQKYCSKSECRKASKAASQRRWLDKPENRDYFSGPANVQRVREWRKKHPGYWKRSGALQDASASKQTETKEESRPLAISPLQDSLAGQHPVLIGLIAQLTGSTLQDDIVRTAGHFIQLGQDILSGQSDIPGGKHAHQAYHPP